MRNVNIYLVMALVCTVVVILFTVIDRVMDESDKLMVTMVDVGSDPKGEVINVPVGKIGVGLHVHDANMWDASGGDITDYSLKGKIVKSILIQNRGDIPVSVQICYINEDAKETNSIKDGNKITFDEIYIENAKPKD
jgi:hypothetical protein